MHFRYGKQAKIDRREHVQPKKKLFAKLFGGVEAKGTGLVIFPAAILNFTLVRQIPMSDFGKLFFL